MSLRTHNFQGKVNLASIKNESHPKPPSNEHGMQSLSHVNVQPISVTCSASDFGSSEIILWHHYGTIHRTNMFCEFSNAFFPIIEPHFGEYIFSYSTSSTWLEKLT